MYEKPGQENQAKKEQHNKAQVKRRQREIVTNLLLRYSLFNPFGHFLYDLYLFYSR